MSVRSSPLRRTEEGEPLKSLEGDGLVNVHRLRHIETEGDDILQGKHQLKIAACGGKARSGACGAKQRKGSGQYLSRTVFPGDDPSADQANRCLRQKSAPERREKDASEDGVCTHQEKRAQYRRRMKS